MQVLSSKYNDICCENGSHKLSKLASLINDQVVAHGSDGSIIRSLCLSRWLYQCQLSLQILKLSLRVCQGRDTTSLFKDFQKHLQGMQHEWGHFYIKAKDILHQ